MNFMKPTYFTLTQAAHFKYCVKRHLEVISLTRREKHFKQSPLLTPSRANMLKIKVVPDDTHEHDVEAAHMCTA